MTKFINLTPHAIRVRSEESNIATPLESDLVIAAPAKGEMPAIRITENIVHEEAIDGVRIRTTQLGAIIGLPDPQDGVMLVVSMPTAERAYALGRRDVVSPDTGEDQIRFKLPNGNEGTYAVRGFRFIDGK